MGDLLDILANNLNEVLAVEVNKLKLLGCRLARTISSSKRSSTPWRATENLSHVGDNGGFVADWHEDNTAVTENFVRRSITEGVANSLMGEEGESGQGGGLLSTVLGTGGGDDGCELLVQGLGEPETTSLIEECAELSNSTTVTGWDNEDEAVELGEVVGGDHCIREARGSTLLGQYFSGECFGT